MKHTTNMTKLLKWLHATCDNNLLAALEQRDIETRRCLILEAQVDSLIEQRDNETDRCDNLAVDVEELLEERNQLRSALADSTYDQKTRAMIAETFESCAKICERLVVGGRAWTEEQAAVADSLFFAAKTIRSLKLGDCKEDMSTPIEKYCHNCVQFIAVDDSRKNEPKKCMSHQHSVAVQEWLANINVGSYSSWTCPGFVKATTPVIEKG